MINFIPYVCSAGGQTPGSERAAIDLKQSGTLEGLAKAGLEVNWQVDPDAIYEMPFGKAAHESLPALGTAERKEIVLWHCRYLQEQVMKAIEGGALPFTVGGDHAMALGSISAVAKAKNAFGRIGVIWVDAHPDFNTPETSPSQALHGMPLAALTGRGDADYVALVGDRPAVDPRKIVYIGIRDIDEGEQEFIDSLGINAFTMEDVDRLGIEAVMEKAKAIVSTDTDACVLSIDVDGFDPAYAPATGTPVPHGLQPDSTLPALKKLVADVDFDLIEVTEFNPTLPGRDQTYALVEGLFKSLLLRQAA